ncbi:MAG: amidohydrolase [Bacteroidales bacterium]
MGNIIFTNGNVFTGLRDRPEWSTLVVSGGEIVFIGNRERAMEYNIAGTRIIDLKGKTLMPGFYEGHAHGTLGGLLMNCCLLSPGKSIRDYLSIIGDYCSSREGLRQVKGFGWVHGFFGTGGPLKETLDKAVPGIPAVFLSIDYHSCWVNSKALAMAGIDKHTPDPHGGKIERHEETGEPTGCLRESPAIDLVMKALDPPAKAEWEEAVRTYMKLAAQHGIVGIFDAGVLNADQPEVFQVIHEMDERDELTVRFRQSYVLGPDTAGKDIETLRALRSRYGSGKNFRVEVAKIFMDGAIEGHTGFLLDPYKDREGFTGRPVWAPDVFEKTVRELHRGSFQIHVHTIGDGAVRAALNGLEKAVKEGGAGNMRHTLAHIELIDPADIPRLSNMGMVASFQPAWFYMDDNYFQETLPLLARSRADRRYVLRDFIKNGVDIAFGSDWPWGTVSSSMDPLLAIGTAVTRQDPEKADSAPYEPEEKIGLASALALHTRGGAWQNFSEAFNGTLEVGKKADLVVLNANLFDLPLSELDHAGVEMTFFEGRCIFPE